MLRDARSDSFASIYVVCGYTDMRLSPLSFLFKTSLTPLTPNLGYSLNRSSLAEYAKANGLKVFDYIEYLLTELPKHADDKKRDFLENLLP